MITSLRNFTCMLLACLLCHSLIAQNDSLNTSQWKYKLGPYLLFPSMNGDVAIRGILSDVDVDSGDIFSNLDFGMMLVAEASNDQWTIAFDLLYMDLGQEGTTPLASRRSEVDIKQLAIQLGGYYRITNWLEAGVGGRFNSLKSTVEIAPGEYILPGSKFEMTESWFDPLIMARAITQINNSNWRLGIIADIGGFGVGSDFSWQFNPFVSYSVAKWLNIAAAYRWIHMNYDTGTGTDYFLYDMLISGPEIGFIFKFN